MKFLGKLAAVLFGTVLATVSAAEERQYGSFIFSPDAPNALFFMDEIRANDDFELRKALRNHGIDTLVLASPGGSVWAGLSMAGIVFDKKLRVVIPEFSACASACSFMFFGGAERLGLGRLGVHQFSSSGNLQASLQQTQSASQFTVSEIIGFLNEFDTPRFVLERMFQAKEMYWFNDAEKTQLNSRDFTLDQARLDVIQQLYQSKLRPKVQDKSKEPKTTEKEIIANIQKKLNAIGCSAGVVDGVWGKRTEAAAARFARKAEIAFSGITSVSKDFLDALNTADKGYCPELPKPIFASRWSGSYSCDYVDGNVMGWLTSASKSGFKLKLTFNKVDGTPQQPDRIIRNSSFSVNGLSVHAVPIAESKNHLCPDGAVSNMRSSCPTRPLEGGERLFGQFDSRKKIMRLSGMVHPMGRCKVVLQAR